VTAPFTLAAWREVAMLHLPNRAVAGERDDGTCAYCKDPDEPRPPLLSRYLDYFNGSRRKVWVHEHLALYCSTCGGGYDGQEDWPCITWEAMPAEVQRHYEPTLPRWEPKL
jgi:hypothetical protein